MVSAGFSLGQEIKLVITFVYLLLGMAIVAMCHYLLKEEVGLKGTSSIGTDISSNTL